MVSTRLASRCSISTGAVVRSMIFARISVLFMGRDGILLANEVPVNLQISSGGAVPREVRLHPPKHQPFPGLPVAVRPQGPSDGLHQGGRSVFAELESCSPVGPG